MNWLLNLLLPHHQILKNSTVNILVTSEVDLLYVKCKEGGRGLISIENCVISEKNNLGL